MDVKVARFRCKHPKCAGNSAEKNDFSVQTIYEHVAQHLFEDTHRKDHFNLRCSCSGKATFSLLPYATYHLDQHRTELHRHSILSNSITINDVPSSRRILCYQKRFVEFKEYKMEKDDCPELAVYPVNATREPFVPLSMQNGMSFPPPNFNMFGSAGQDYGSRTPVRSSSPVGTRTPVFGARSPARDDYSPPPYNSRRSSGPPVSRSPPHGAKRMTPAFDSQRRESGRHENGGYRGGRGGYGGFGRDGSRSPDERNNSFRGRGRGNYRGRDGAGGGFRRHGSQSPDERNNSFRGRGRGSYRGRGGFGRDSEGFNGDRDGSSNRNHEKRAREAASPRSSDDEAPVKKNTDGPQSFVSNDREGHNSGFRGRGSDHNNGASSSAPFTARRRNDDTRSSGIRPRENVSPRSSDED